MTASTNESQETFVVISSKEEVILKLDNEDEHAKSKKKLCGFHLTRSKWDPYPWVGFVERASVADKAGLRSGDCLLEVNGKDVVGLRVKDIASLIYTNNNNRQVTLQVWRSPLQVPDHEDNNTDGIALEGPLPEVARKLASAVSDAVRVLECPICLESAAPPVSQCVHGHIICVACRPKTARCPVCRVRLGQGRCLLADNFHRILREAFDITDNREGYSLRERLFGKRKKLQSNNNNNNNNNNNRVPVKPRQLLARLFLGGFDKAMSIESLPVMTQTETTVNQEASVITQRLSESNLNDRAKSASTGELSASREPIRTLQQSGVNAEFVNASNPDVMSHGTFRCNSSLLSAPQTPRWGGSTESVFNTSIRCPTSSWTGCNEMVTPGIALEHLSRAHEGPQIHFYHGNATIPLPVPLGPNAIYILHHGGDIFFFKYKDEIAWVTTTGAGNEWEWTLHGWGENGTEVKLRKCVSTLEDPLTFSSHQVAPLPKALLIRTMSIQLLERGSNEGLEM